MQTTRPRGKKVTLPSDDPRWRRVELTLLRYDCQPHSLIEVLHTIEAEFGYLDNAALHFVAEALHISPSKVYGVATFYQLFSFTPPALHSCTVCTGTACHIRGADKILHAVEESYGLNPGDTSSDGVMSLKTARCLSFCGPAPVVEYDSEPVGNATAATVVQHIGGWIDHDTRRN